MLPANTERSQQLMSSLTFAEQQPPYSDPTTEITRLLQRIQIIKNVEDRRMKDRISHKSERPLLL